MNDDDKKTKELFQTIFGLIIILIIAGSIYYHVSEFFGKRSDAKEYCSKSQRVLNAKTDYAAKKAYKACVSNY